MNRQLITNAASHALKAYTPYSNEHTHIRQVEQFRPIGELVALVTLDPQHKEAFVAFRGTELFGNWVFTNFQAFFSPLAIVDDSLLDAASVPLQAGAYRLPLVGSAHQGFSRAFTWLWYGTDPLVGIAKTHVGGPTRWRVPRDGIIVVSFLLLWVIAVALGLKLPIAVPLLVALLLSLLVTGFERGTWEDLHRVKPSTKGPALCRLLPELNKHEVVVFTGHSLGGAIAVIAFAVYRLWCTSCRTRKDNARLVTFGAPRVGDQDFCEAFEKKHTGRFIHVVHPGDPVPEMPTRRPTTLLSYGFCLRSWLGVVITTLSPLWSLYAFFYRLGAVGVWSSTNVLLTADGPGTLAFANHDMKQYETAVSNMSTA